MYVCGITPYDTTHLGHAFTYVFFDTLKRFLEFQGYKVNYTQNNTDIDDDILKKAQKTDQNWQVLGDFWTKQFLSDIEALNISKPDHYIKATEAIDTIIKMIQILLDKGYGYESGGNIYFDVSKFPDYGKLSKLTSNEMSPILDERGGSTKDPLKKNPLDFILWQNSKVDEPFWISPWGNGRPGWHIECSAMVECTLGDQIDIHGGGADLIYPHHESEIAQSESFTGKPPFVKYWIHIGMLSFEGEKMSKSLGNLVLVKDLLKNYSPNVVRWVLLSHHYRSEWEFKMKELNNAEEIIKSLSFKEDDNTDSEVLKTLEDDMDTPKALSLIKDKPSKKILELLGFKI